jgi:hypothetical protein
MGERFCIENTVVNGTVDRHLFVDFQWSPEEISNRLKFEHADFSISFITIYRGDH